MKIKTKLYMIIIFTVVITSSIIFLHLRWYQQEKKLQASENSVSALQLAIFEIGQVKNEYFMYGEERAKMQWQIKVERIARTLGKMSQNFTGPQERDALHKIAKFHDAQTDLFNRLVRLDEGGQVNIAPRQDLRARIINQVLVNSHAQYLEALTLRKLIQGKREVRHKLTHLYSNIALGLLVLYLIYFTLVIIRGVTHPLTRLYEGTEIIARGNLDYKTDIRTRDEIGRLSESFDAMTDNLKKITVSRDELNKEIAERKRTEEKLRETRDYLENLFGYAKALIIVWNPEFRITRFNRAFERLTGYIAEEVIGKNLQILFPDSSREESLVKIESTLSGEYWESVEIPILRKDGNTRLALWNSANIYTKDGATLMATIAQGQDITERKQQTTELLHSNREKALLLKEIHHRVKNNLQIIASLLRLSAKYSGDERVEEIFRESQDRIRAMAAVHSILYKSENLADINFGDYIRETATQLFRSYNANPEAISLLINADNVMLPIDAAIPCGLIINELVSNALKHAFPEGRRGESRIEMKKDENGVRIIFEDNGAGFPEGMDFRNTETLGLQLVNMLVAQLDGTIEIEMVRNGGTRYVITLKTGKP